MARRPTEIPLRCRCGHVHGVASEVAPNTGFRFVCYCGDCQAFARFLERPDVLDLSGGTDIFQMPIGRVKLTAGAGFPVVGLIHSFMNPEADGRSRDEVLGAPLGRIYERSATGPLPADAPPPFALAFFPRRAATLLGWWLRGLGRPNPFFDERTKAPLSMPRAFTPEERAAL